MGARDWIKDRGSDIGAAIWDPLGTTDQWGSGRTFGIPEDAAIRENFLDPLVGVLTPDPKSDWEKAPIHDYWQGAKDIGGWFTSPALPVPGDPDWVAPPGGTWEAKSEAERLEQWREWAESDDLNPEAISGAARGSMDEVVIPWLQAGGQFPWDEAVLPEDQRGVELTDWTRPGFTPDVYDPSGVSNAYNSYIDALEGAGSPVDAYNNYLGLLEGMVFEPRTDRIEDIYNLAVDEAARRRETVEGYEETAGARLKADSELFLERLGTSLDEFDAEVDVIRDGQKDRLAGFKTTRQENIDAAAAELGDAAATFLISSTRSTDILDAQADSQITHSDRFDRLYAGWALDREMSAQGLVGKEARDLADRVLAMKEAIFQFEYDAGVDRLEALDVAETTAAENMWELQQQLATGGLQRDLAGIDAASAIAEKGFERDIAVEEGRRAHEAEVDAAREQYDNDWDRAEGLLENPNTGWVFAGMTPQQIIGMSDAQLKMVYDTAIQESNQVEVSPGVFVPMSTFWTTMMGQQGGGKESRPWHEYGDTGAAAQVGEWVWDEGLGQFIPVVGPEYEYAADVVGVPPLEAIVERDRLTAGQ